MAPARKKATKVTSNEESTPGDPGTDETPAQPVEVSPEEQVHYDDTDVPAALERETQDGKGDDQVPEADFQSFATEGVENEEQN